MEVAEKILENKCFLAAFISIISGSAFNACADELFILVLEISYMITELIEIIEKLIEKIADDSDMVWTAYETSQQLKDELEVYLNQFQAGDMSSMGKIKMLFLPTGTLQEHSMSNSWSDEFLNLSKKFDRLYMTIKRY